MSEQKYEYYAFVSYSRKDEVWAKWLHEKLEAYKLPNIIRKESTHLPERVRPVFRDKTDIGAGDLEKTLRQELTDSRYLIVICSPNSAKSEWVNKEVETFIELGREDRIIPFIIEGKPDAQEVSKKCYPPALSPNILGISVEELGREQAFVKVVASILRLKFDRLWNRHKRREVAKRRMNITITLVLLISVFAGGAFAYDYFREKTAYYSDYVEKWGIPQGLFKVEEQDLKNYAQAYRFSESQRKLHRVDHVNSKGVIFSVWDTLPVDRPASQVFEYKSDGALNAVTHLNDKGNAEMRIQYSGEKLLIADFTSADKEGTAVTAAANSKVNNYWSVDENSSANRSDISRYQYERDSNGIITKTLYMRDNRNKIIADANGVFGKKFTLDDKGRIIQINHIDNKGQNKTLTNGKLDENSSMIIVAIS